CVALRLDRVGLEFAPGVARVGALGRGERPVLEGGDGAVRREVAVVRRLLLLEGARGGVEGGAGGLDGHAADALVAAGDDPDDAALRRGPLDVERPQGQWGSAGAG